MSIRPILVANRGQLDAREMPEFERSGLNTSSVPYLLELGRVLQEGIAHG